MQTDKENQHSYITTFSADRCGGNSELVDVTVQPHSMASLYTILTNLKCYFKTKYTLAILEGGQEHF